MTITQGRHIELPTGGRIVMTEEALALLAAHDPQTCSACARERRSNEARDARTALLAVQVARLDQMGRLLSETEEIARTVLDSASADCMSPGGPAMRATDYVRVSMQVCCDHVERIKAAFVDCCEVGGVA